MFPVLKSIHYISLYLFLGGPAFWYFVWRPAVRDGLPNETKLLQRRVRLGFLIGALLFGLSGFADALRAAAQMFSLSDFETLALFFTTSRFGRLTVIKIALAGVVVVSLLMSRRQTNKAFLALSGASGLGLLVVTSLLSHAAGKPGIMPVISDVVHMIASILWAGGLLYLAVVPWQGMRHREINAANILAVLVERFTNMALVAVVMVAATGAFASYLHVYSPAALQMTNYGRTLVLKIALFVVLLVVAGVNLMSVAPGLRRAERKTDSGLFHQTVAKFARYTRIEAGVLVGLLVAVGVLTTLPPADTLNEVRQSSWQLQAGEHRVNVLMYATGSEAPGEVQFSIGVTDAEGNPVADATRVILDLDMVSHAMGIPPLEAEREGPGRYRARALISMAGPWRGQVRVVSPEDDVALASFDFQAAQGARSVGQTRRFDIRAVTFSPTRLIYLVAGGVWFIAALYGVINSRKQKLPRWFTPVGMLGLGMAGYLLFSATLVDAYPTAFVRSPIPFEARHVEAGRQLFAVHCAYCHGPDGLGDGELAPLLETPPVDLSEAHVDDHTDGEIFWWVTHGIPPSGMPGVGTALTEEERWQLVMFVRSIRRPVPEL